MLSVMCPTKLKMPSFLCIFFVQFVSIGMTPTMLLCVECHNICLSCDKATVPAVLECSSNCTDYMHVLHHFPSGMVQTTL